MFTAQEARKWFATHEDESWSIWPKDGLNEYSYLLRNRLRKEKGPWYKERIYCVSYEVFIELMDACNATPHWTSEHVPNAPKKEDSGQLLMF